MLRTTTDGVSLRAGSSVVIRYLAADPRVLAIVRASAPTAAEVQKEARDLGFGALIFLLFGVAGLVGAWTTGESDGILIAVLCIVFAVATWFYSRYVRS